MSDERIYYSHDAEIHAVREMTKLMVLRLMIGLGIGAGLALLFAPTSGRKVRDNLTRTVEKGWNNGRDVVEPMVKRIEEEFGELQKSIEANLK